MSQVSSFSNAIEQPLVGEIISVIPSQEFVLTNSGYLRCNGAIVSQSTYPALYAQVGLIADGINTWTPRTSGTTSQINALTFGNGLYVYGGAGGVLGTSTDAITWTLRTSGTTSIIRTLIYANSLYVYAGAGGVLATSTNAITWTLRTSGTTSQINALTYANGLYVYAGAGGVLATSTDAITWTLRTSGTTSNINALTFGNGLYVYGTNAPPTTPPPTTASGIFTSTNAITWTLTHQDPFVVNILSLTYGNGLYFYGTFAGLLRTSTNATNWFYGTTNNNQTLSGSRDINALIYADGIYVSASSASSFFGVAALGTSTNGALWIPQVITTTFNIFALTYGNGLYVYAGAGGSLGTAPKYTYNTATQFALPNITSINSMIKT